MKKLGLITVISSIIASICFTISILLNIAYKEYDIIYQAIMLLLNIYLLNMV